METGSWTLRQRLTISVILKKTVGYSFTQFISYHNLIFKCTASINQSGFVNDCNIICTPIFIMYLAHFIKSSSLCPDLI